MLERKNIESSENRNTTHNLLWNDPTRKVGWHDPSQARGGLAFWTYCRLDRLVSLPGAHVPAQFPGRVVPE